MAESIAAHLHSPLFEAAEAGEASIGVIFGGQSTANSLCVARAADLYSAHRDMVEPLVTTIDALLRKLSTSLLELQTFFLGREISLRNWLTNPTSQPDKVFIASAAVSFPIIGLLDLMQFCVIGKTLKRTPKQLRRLFCGMTGHSQGIVVAAALARSDCNSWQDFVRVAEWAVELLFWIGWESHSAAPHEPLAPSVISDCVQKGHGTPSHMLSVRGLHRSQLDTAVATCNSHLNKNHLHVALVNGSRNYTVAGTPRSLVGLTRRLQRDCLPAGADQSKVPFSQRKPTVTCQFLPVSAPFHTPHLSEASQRAKDRFAISQSASRHQNGWRKVTVSHLDLALPHTETGRDVRHEYPGTTDLADVLIDAVATKQLDWPKALRITNGTESSSHAVTHMIVLAGGGLSTLVHQNVDGRGIRVIDGVFHETQADDNLNTTAIGGRSELFDHVLEPGKLRPQSWKDKFAPRIRKTLRGLDSDSDLVHVSSLSAAKAVEDSTTHYHTHTPTVETRLNQVLNAPPIMVAGMTPTTVHPDFVSAVINSGYHVEMAGGGYFNATDMAAAIEVVTNQIPSRRGITINLIYASPVAMGWQIPLLQSLIRRGVPIEGLTLGAGVPSPDVVAGYIENLGPGSAGTGTEAQSNTTGRGIRHISFKPGTADSIREVVAIARSHPKFPIILQWTGGRGGGHHSTEDFHEPLLETYSEIRSCENLYLVVGSGFGDGTGMLPYFKGTWSLQFGRPAMPVDGILMGSRMMVAREAHTSPQAKALLLKASGVEDSKWETSYSARASVLTVISEMGQPIHKLSTRGTRFWKQLDDTIFSLPRSKRKEALQKRREEIIRGLNMDSHRPWFGRDAKGKSVELQDMTYAETLSRLVQLLYIKHQQRWIDSSYQKLFQEFAVRLLERLSSPSKSGSSNSVELHFGSDSPYCLVAKINAACSEASTQLIHPEDARHFIQLCRARGRKPAPFILDLDEDFEHWFKKDSLWQSEDVDAVVDQDAERVCILHSPVSLRYATRDDQSAGEILDGIQRDLALLMARTQHETLSDKVKSQWFSPISSPASSWVEDGMPTSNPFRAAVSGVQMERTMSHLVLRPVADNVDHGIWRGLLEDHISNPALSALVSSATVSRAKADPLSPMQTNCFRQIFSPRRGFSVHVHVSEDELLLVHDHDKDGQSKTSVLVRVSVPRSSPRGPHAILYPSRTTELRIQLYHHHHVEGVVKAQAKINSPTQIMLEWTYDNKARRLLDTMDGSERDRRVQSFFAELWLPRETPVGQNIVAVPADKAARKQSSSQPLPVVIRPQVYETLHTAVGQAFASSSPIPRFPKGYPIAIEAAMIAAWDALVQPLVSHELQGDLLRLVHRSVGVNLEPGADPLSVGEEDLVCNPSVRAVTIEPSGKSIKVQVDVLRDGGRTKAATIHSEFFIRGRFDNWEGTFRDEDRRFEVHVGSEVEEAVLRDRQWFHLNTESDSGATGSSSSLVGMTLVFELKTHACYRDQSSYSSIRTHGTVVQKSWNGAMKPIGSVFFETAAQDQGQGCWGGDPVIDFLERKVKEFPVHGGGFAKVPLQKPGWDGNGERVVAAPTQRQSRLYAAASGDLNPIHTSPVFAALAEIPGDTTIVHGMYTVAVCRQAVEDICGLSTDPQEQRGRLRSFSADLVGMVRPGESMRISVVHEAMIGGRMVLQVTARLVDSGEVVLQGEAEVEQPPTAYVFTGQGSQSQGMGMALYKSSPVAKALWDEIDGVLMDQFGWSIMHIVNDNPTELTIYFGGPKGQKVLRNYLAMTAEVPTNVPASQDSMATQATEVRPLIPDLTPESESYTFRDSRGLVHATQFAQPAIMLLEKATVEHLRANGLLQEGAVFAGHSLGEWGALSCMAGLVEFKETMNIAFYRGLLMHFAIPRDEYGRTGYSMVAVNPGRAGPGFDDAGLRTVVGHIAHASGLGMEIVNFNVEAEQYVCAGHVRNIHVLTSILDALASCRAKTTTTTIAADDDMQEFIHAPSENQRSLTRLGRQVATFINTSRSLPLDVELKRGRATVPLTAIDIPFHSQILRPGIAAFRRILEARLRVEDFRPELVVGRWITNVLGDEFSLGADNFKKASQVMSSTILERLARQIS